MTELGLGHEFEPGTAETVSCDYGENTEGGHTAHPYHYHGVSDLLVDLDRRRSGPHADGHLVYYSKPTTRRVMRLAMRPAPVTDVSAAEVSSSTAPPPRHLHQ